MGVHVVIKFCYQYVQCTLRSIAVPHFINDGCDAIPHLCMCVVAYIVYQTDLSTPAVRTGSSKPFWN